MAEILINCLRVAILSFVIVVVSDPGEEAFEKKPFR